MSAVEELRAVVPTSRACDALGVPRSSVYRARRGPQPKAPAKPRAKPARALSETERAEVRATLNSKRFADQPPRAAYAALLEEGQYLCHWRTMYRVLAEHGEVRERRDQLRHPAHAKPVLVARQPNEVWSWDITKLRGPAKWRYYYLYVILDIFSRYVVGWMVAEKERQELARRLIAATCAKQGIDADQLTLHADRGAPMTAKTVAELLIDLGVAKSHARPHVSDDNPFSEAQFKTLKYRPEFPERFGCPQDARAVCRELFEWYNHEHYHSALGLMTPATVHNGQVERVRHARQRVLDAAYAARPERFVNGPPIVAAPATEVWINQPASGLVSTATELELPARDATARAPEPGAQAGSTAAEGRAERSVDAAEHPATAGLRSERDLEVTMPAAR